MPPPNGPFRPPSGVASDLGAGQPSHSVGSGALAAARQKGKGRFQGIEILWLILVHQQTKISNPLQEIAMITSDFRDPSLLYHLPVPKLHKSNFNFEVEGRDFQSVGGV